MILPPDEVTTRRAFAVVAFALFLPWLAGCGTTREYDGGFAEPASEARRQLDATAAPKASAALDEAQSPADRLVIHDADLELRVTNPDDARERARTLARSRGGFVKFEGDDRIVLRVPATRFEDTIAAVGTIGPILSRKITATDVTEEYHDLELRLRVRTKYLVELERLYERGGSIKDLLEIKREMEKVTEEIERIKGRVRFLKDRVSLATITLRFRAGSADPVQGGFNLPFRWLKQLGVDQLLEARR